MDDHTLSDWDYTRPVASPVVSPTDPRTLEELEQAGITSLQRVIHKLCHAAGITVYRHFDGRHCESMQVMAVCDLPRLIRYIIANYRPGNLRFDRASLLVWLLGLEQDVKVMDRARRSERVPATWFERRLDAEVYRIARLREPARTIAAVELMNRLKDATIVSKLVRESGQIARTPRHPGGYAWWKQLAKMAHARDDAVDGQ